MENITPSTNNFSYNNTDLLFNSYYDSSHSSSDLLFDIYHDSLYNSSNPTYELHDFPPNLVFELYDSSYDSSDLFLGDLDETQIENDETIDIIVSPEYNTVLRRNDDQKDYNDDNNECDGKKRKEGNLRCDEDQEEYNDDSSECESEEKEEENELKLYKDMEFETWELAESYLDEYAKQQGFCFRKKRRVPDPLDNTITRRRTYECSHAQIHEAQKVILAENRRDR